MALSIKDAETDRLARELSRRTGESLTDAVATAIRERLQRLNARSRGRSLADELDEIAKRCGRLTRRDRRSSDEIIDYDEHGLPR
ncbi:MAG: type II toxin-antitoxin system VapB family antitoxin [Proteobacteria bacterium]|nr:type II toxin-antitoxin system VapB family antitoxin [Pseudomonadota bacterium]MBI3497626.1 type II toxin-antitoxin system VapB family antitoxin [Pseudomonadota bacterium]